MTGIEAIKLLSDGHCLTRQAWDSQKDFWISTIAPDETYAPYFALHVFGGTGTMYISKDFFERINEETSLSAWASIVNDLVNADDWAIFEYADKPGA
jgi:hypothetical protein